MNIFKAVIGDVLSKTVDGIFGHKMAKQDIARLKLEIERELENRTFDAEMQILDAQVKTNLGQMEVNKEEAKSDSIFKSGWRPWIGWVGGVAIAYQFVLRPLLEWFMGLGVSLEWFAVPEGIALADLIPPQIELEDLKALIMGMLGIGALRTGEKFKGIANVPTAKG